MIDSYTMGNDIVNQTLIGDIFMSNQFVDLGQVEIVLLLNME